MPVRVRVEIGACPEHHPGEGSATVDTVFPSFADALRGAYEGAASAKEECPIDITLKLSWVSPDDLTPKERMVLAARLADIGHPDADD